MCGLPQASAQPAGPHKQAHREARVDIAVHQALQVQFAAAQTKAHANCAGLATLKLDGTLVTIIQGHTFDGLSALTTLELPRTIEKLATDAFAGLTALMALTLGSDRLLSIAPRAFAGLPSLVSLSLQYCGITVSTFATRVGSIRARGI